MDKDLILHLEELARLRLSADEREKTAAEINEIIEYFNTLSQLDTEGIEPLSHAFYITNVMRADEVCPSLSAEEILKNAKTENGFFIVPSSVEEEG